jgi:hypothetical protein
VPRRDSAFGRALAGGSIEPTCIAVVFLPVAPYRSANRTSLQGRSLQGRSLQGRSLQGRLARAISSTPDPATTAPATARPYICMEIPSLAQYFGATNL